MEYIWAPWRMEFIQSADKKTETCFLCQKPQEHDDKLNYILYRGTHNYVLLNAYPYNPGHLLVAPYRHEGKIENLTDDEAAEHFNLTRKSVVLLTYIVKCTGFNVGMNLGKIAGAGIDDHIHTHIVPRWQGDTNFMPAVGNTKVLPEALSATYDKLMEGVARAFLNR
ncbi:MAG TPA: HIT family hydrolase [Dehalococcoidia bacterium]|nr:HIT family hydrolase [Dehalococcoidia bacterium]